METVKMWTTVIAQVGFPIAVAGFVLLRLDKSLGKLSDGIADLSKTVALMNERVSSNSHHS